MRTLEQVLTRLLRLACGLVGAQRRDWPEALLAEANEAPPGSARVAWLGGGLWLVARQAPRRLVLAVLAFAAAAMGVVWITWQGSPSDSAVPVNRAEVPVALALLAGLPLIVRRRCGPVRVGRSALAVRVGVYTVVLALIAAQAVQAREGQKLGAYFHDFGIVRGALLLVVAGYAAVMLIATSDRVRLTRSTVPIAIGTATVVVLFAFAGTGMNLASMTRAGWVVMGVAITLTTGVAVARFAARDTRPDAMPPARQGGIAVVCAVATAAVLLVAITTASIALFPQRVPLQTPPPPANGGCETCDPNNLVIPPGLRHEYWVELSVDQAGGAAFVLLAAPFLCVSLGAIGLAVAATTRPRRTHRDPHPTPPAPTASPPR